jgi:hypothetical protein
MLASFTRCKEVLANHQLDTGSGAHETQTVAFNIAFGSLTGEAQPELSGSYDSTSCSSV